MDTILPPGPGHNLPPAHPLDLIRDELAEKHADLIERGRQLEAMKARIPAACDDDEQAEKLITGIRLCTAFAGDSGSCEAARKVAKQPHLDAGKTVDAWFKGLTTPVLALKADMTKILTVYQRKKAAEEQRRRDEEAAEARRLASIAAERAKNEDQQAKAAELEETARAAEAAASANAAEMSRARTDYGNTASLRTTWKFEVTDAAAVPRQYLTVNEAAITAAIRASTSADKKRCDLSIPGVRIYADTQSVVV